MKFQVVVLNVRSHAIIDSAVQSVTASAIEWDGAERRKLLGYRQREICQRQIRSLREDDARAGRAFEYAWRIAHIFEDGIDADEIVACVIPAISGAQDGFISSKPRKRPAQSNRGSKVIRVVSVKLFARIRRVLTNELDGRQATA